MTIAEYNDCVKIYADGVFRFVLKNITQYSDAEDIVQSAFEKLWMKRETINYEKAKSYLFSIAHNTMIDWIRRKKFTDAYQSVPDKGEYLFEKQFETKQLIDQCLAQLPPIQKSLILLRDYEGYDYEEIANITTLSLSQVKVYLFRARKKLQHAIELLEKVV